MTSYTIGLMSGTSLDGVDGVLARFSQTGQPTLVARSSLALDPDLRKELMALNKPCDNELHRAACAANSLMHGYAQVVADLLTKSGLDATQVSAIGSHGQTVRHRPELGYTIQLNAPALLAELTGISVIADFRSRDVAAGGQGAPLVPAFHRAVFGTHRPCVILNLGGIANVTVLVAGRPVIGFDTGPANMLLDLWCERHTGTTYDQDGQWASTGNVDEALLNHLLKSEPWFSLAPPKSTGRDLFSAQWLEERLATYNQVRPQDVQATLVALTTRSIVNALDDLDLSGTPIYACGGGALNSRLIGDLQTRWAAPVKTTQELGIHTQDVEALAFAWLAWAYLNKNAGNLPEVTGASGQRILGAYWPA